MSADIPGGQLPGDERAVRVDGAADRLAYLAVSYGLLLSVVYRSLIRGDDAWDLLALVVLGGAVGLAYRARQGVVTSRWIAMLLATVAIAIVVAGLLVVGGH